MCTEHEILTALSVFLSIHSSFGNFRVRKCLPLNENNGIDYSQVFIEEMRNELCASDPAHRNAFTPTMQLAVDTHSVPKHRDRFMVNKEVSGVSVSVSVCVQVPFRLIQYAPATNALWKPVFVCCTGMCVIQWQVRFTSTITNTDIGMVSMQCICVLH